MSTLRAPMLLALLTAMPSCTSAPAVGDVAANPPDIADASAPADTPVDDVNQPVEGSGWRITFRDEFNGAAEAVVLGDDPSCYTREAMCLKHYMQPVECQTLTSDELASLAGLNKCSWSIMAHYNWMDQDAEQGQRINSFAPTMVEVKDGFLNLKADNSGYSDLNCGEPLEPGQETWKTHWGSRCPIISGGLVSKPSAEVPGFVQKYGRFEVRAKLPSGIGAWPAHWLLPEGGDWPDHGEIDVMEYWANNLEKVHGNFHTESVEEGHISSGYHVDDPVDKEGTWYLDFHLYAVEWTPDEIRFFVDDKMYHRVENGQYIKGQKDYLYPYHDFYWILNSTIAPFVNDESVSPLFNEFHAQDHLIDYVRVYERCELSEAGCEVVELPSLEENGCPSPRKYLGLFDDGSKPVCRKWPHVKISQSSCLELGRFVWRNHCLEEREERYIAREID